MLVMTEVAPVCVASHEDGVGARTRRGAWEVGASQESRASHGDGEGLCTRMGSCTRGFGPGAGAFAPGRGLARGWGCSHEDGPCTRMGLCTTTGPRLSTVRGQPGFGGAGQRRSSPAPLPRVCKPRLPAVTRVVSSCRSPRCPQQTWRRRLPPLVALNKHGHRPRCPQPTWRRRLTLALLQHGGASFTPSAAPLCFDWPRSYLPCLLIGPHAGKGGEADRTWRRRQQRTAGGPAPFTDGNGPGRAPPPPPAMAGNGETPAACPG